MGEVKVVKASAGSGKTFNLAYAFVREVIREPMHYRHTLAVTFTNKATEEMKSRIINELDLLAEGQHSQYLPILLADLDFSPEQIRSRAVKARAKILHDYSRFYILTIDKFFQRIIRSFIKELGIDVNFNLELQTDSLLSRAADELIDMIPEDKELRSWIFALVEENIEAGKRWDIRDELISLGGEIFSEGYRMGQSRVSSREDIKNLVDSSSKQAAKIESNISEIAKRGLQIISDAGLVTSDFAGGSRSFANYFVKISQGVIDAPGASVVKAVVDASKWSSKTSPKKRDIDVVVPTLQPLLSELCDLYRSNIKYLNSVKLLRSNYRNFALLNDLASKVEQLCVSGNVMHISETNDILRRLISNNDAPFIFEKAGNTFSRFMIDEFQDTSTMQWCNFIPLLENALAQSEESPVMLVGDVKQSIYRWRGGDWQILAHRVAEQFGEVENQLLDTNYRSLPTVVEFNNAIIGCCADSDNLQLNERLEEACDGGYITKEVKDVYFNTLQDAYVDHSQMCRPNSEGGYVNITHYSTDDDGVPPIIERVEQLQKRGYKANEIAIIVRYNKQGSDIANILLRYKSEHPESKYCYDVVTQEALTIGSSDVAHFVAAVMMLAISRSDAIKLAQYNRFLDRGFDDELPVEDQEFLDSIHLLPIQEAFERIVMRYGLGQRANAVAYLQAMHEQVITFGGSNISDIPLFLKWWYDQGVRRSINTPQSRDAITIISVHKAKGLQYRVLIVPYCSWTLDPNPRTLLWAEGQGTPFDALERIPMNCSKKGVGESLFANEYYKEMVLSHVDNINILYVALTRAEDELHIMIPNSKRGNNVSQLINNAIKIEGVQARLGGLIGRVETTCSGDVIHFGEAVIPKSKQKGIPLVKVLPFTTNDVGSKVRLTLSHKRYVDSGASQSLSPRNYGIAMHKAFERSATLDEVSQTIKIMHRNGVINSGELEHLEGVLAVAMDNPTIKEWFSGEWSMVRNESEIITPGGGMKRPDRVMVRGSEAVVVDYKFGLERSPKYHRQLEQYKDLLKSMGYSSVKGYVWYISIGDVEPV